jgi:hypothetical protein
MSDVFISYTRKNRDRVAALADLLRREGLDVWWDRDLLPGSEWDEEIERQIKGAKCVVVVWSRDSVDRKFVRAEADLASHLDVLVPVLFDEVVPPLAFRMIQAADLTGWRPDRPHPAIEDLLKAIAHKMGQAPKPVPSADSPVPPPKHTPSQVGGQAVSRVVSRPTSRGRPDRQSDSQSAEAVGPPKFPERVVVRWELPLPGEVHQPATVAPNGAVHVITRNGALVCVDPTGAIRWSAIIGGGRGIGGQGIVHSSSGDILAVTDGYMHYVNADGKSRWKWTNRGGVTSAPAVGPDGTVYAMTNQSVLWAVSRAGNELWSRKLCQVSGGGSWPSPAYGQGIIFSACKGRSVYGVNADTGDIAWSFDTNDAVSSSVGRAAVGRLSVGGIRQDSPDRCAVDDCQR